ncbi:hypothetical protein TFLX_04703 [Thermoflexales bacterium]|nr:hypothetical protein TFLX_04703 [Thermoflexales bacterium]
MHKRWISMALIVLLAALLLVSSAGAQNSASFDLSWYTLAGGSGRVASASYAMNGTVGQALVDSSESTSYRLPSGYWQNWPDYAVFLPVILLGL